MSRAYDVECEHAAKYWSAVRGEEEDVRNYCAEKKTKNGSPSKACFLHDLVAICVTDSFA